MEWLAALEESRLAGALKTSFYVYPLINAGHVLAIGFLVTTVTLIDLRVLAILPARAVPSTALLRRLAIGALLAAAASGLSMFAIRASDYAAMGVFRLKLVLIALAAFNFVLLVVLFRGRTDPSGPLARGLAATSLALWLGVLLAGRFIAFV